MTRPKSGIFMRDYLGRYLEDYLRKDGERRARNLGSRDRIVNWAYIPMYPRILWLDARLNYVLGNDVASILLCSAALEAALKGSLAKRYREELHVDFDLALDEMEIRSLIPACEALGIITDKAAKLVRRIGDIRHEYVHSKIAKISKKLMAKIERGGGDLDSFIRDSFIASAAGEDNSLAAITILEEFFRSLYTSPAY